MIGTTLHEGRASGPILRLDEPLSLWGGSDPETGTIVDRRHPQFGETLQGRVLVMPRGRGSSSSATVLAEQIRRGVGPSAIVIAEIDPILPIGALAAAALYGIAVPIVRIAMEEYETLPRSGSLRVDARADSAVLDLEDGDRTCGGRGALSPAQRGV